MVTDPIADLFTRLRNGYMASKPVIEIPHSKLKETLVAILRKNKYVASYEVSGDAKKSISITLNPTKLNDPIPTFKRISTPGCRLYLKSEEIRKSRSGRGIYILSTPKGMITGYEARSLNVWGEIIWEVYY